MTKRETLEMLASIQTAYPRFYQSQSNDDLKRALNLWYEMFATEEASVVDIAVRDLIATLEFPPTIADVKKRVASLKSSATDETLAIDEWNAIKKAIGNSIYNAGEMYETLPDIAKRFVGSPNQLHQWAISTDFNSDVVKGQFLKQYETIKERQKYTELIQGNQRLKELLTNTAQNLLEG